MAENLVMSKAIFHDIGRGAGPVERGRVVWRESVLKGCTVKGRVVRLVTPKREDKGGQK